MVAKAGIMDRKKPGAQEKAKDCGVRALSFAGNIT
jgi:hypothetical protein